MKLQKTWFILVIGVLMFGQSIAAQERLTAVPYLDGELGTLKILHHTIEIGEGSTNFDFVNQGGQEILFPFQRFAAGLELGSRHRVQFLYQPLTVVTNVSFRDDVTIDGVVFPENSPMEITYGFPFYRLSYWYSFFPLDSLELATGASIQLRNASIRFLNLDPQVAAAAPSLTVSQNLGIVPALNFYGKYTLDSGVSFTLDMVGIYASSSFINGADFEFEGSLLDAAFKVALPMRDTIHPFLAVRFIGGSAKGTSEFPRDAWSTSLTPYTSNYLATMSVSLGAQVR